MVFGSFEVEFETDKGPAGPLAAVHSNRTCDVAGATEVWFQWLLGQCLRYLLSSRCVDVSKKMP